MGSFGGVETPSANCFAVPTTGVICRRFLKQPAKFDKNHLNGRAHAALNSWAEQFPARAPEHFVFAYEKYGAAGDDFKPKTYHTDPSKPIGDWKEAWEKAKERSKVSCRFHDLRHTGCTRMLEGGVPYPVVASIMGWSPATAIRMSKRYGHIPYLPMM
jgi:integrase